MDDTGLSLQFCDTHQNLDITGSPSRELDATEVRLWAPDGTLIASVSREIAGSAMLWHAAGSDVVTWYDFEPSGYRSWRFAMQAITERAGHEVPEG